MISASGSVLTGGNGAINAFNCGLANCATVVNSGTILGGMIVSNAIITNSGTVSGGIRFLGDSGSNSLTLQTGALFNGDVVGSSLGATNALIIQGRGTSDNNFTSFNTLNVMPGSVWALTAPFTNIGTTTISGALELDGTILGNTATVSRGGMLFGLGNFSAATTIMSGGMLAPGNAANPTGTLSIGSNLVFQSASLYLVQVTPTNAATTHVSGKATLTDASVQAVFAPGGYMVKSYDILHADRGLGGTTFSGVSGNLPPDFAASLSYTATDVFLNLTAQFPLAGLGMNQLNVGNTITTSFAPNSTPMPGRVG